MAIDFAITTEIARPPNEVFAFVTDPARLHEWQTAVVELEATPPAFEPSGAGTRVTLHAFGEARGAMRLLGPLLGIGLRREFTKQYAALRSALEARVNRTDRQELPT